MRSHCRDPQVSTQTGTLSACSAGHGFVRCGLTDNFYQTSAFIPMSFALVTTVHENGQTGIGPHALCYPFSVSEPYAMLLISRGNSGTAVNIRRTGRCALNYLEFDADRLRAIAALGTPGQPLDEKLRRNPFTLIPSPMAESRADPGFPQIVAEAFQVIECTWNDAIDLGGGHDNGSAHAARFVLNVNQILLQEKFHAGVRGGSVFPHMPVFFGFRASGDFWFAAHEPPFAIPSSRPQGTELQAVKYLATRLDESVRFSDDACERLTTVPRPFLQEAMDRLITEARRGGVLEVTAAFIDEVSPRRTGR